MLKGLGQLGDMAKMMKQAQEMQAKVTELQQELETMTVTGESGAGLVKATATAKGELKGLDIDPTIFNGDDKEVVEDSSSPRSRTLRPSRREITIRDEGAHRRLRPSG